MVTHPATGARWAAARVPCGCGSVRAPNGCGTWWWSSTHLVRAQRLRCGTQGCALSRQDGASARARADPRRRVRPPCRPAGLRPDLSDWQNEEACFVAEGDDVQPGTMMSASGQDDIRGRHRPRHLPRCRVLHPQPSAIHRQRARGRLVPLRQRMAAGVDRHDPASLRLQRGTHPCTCKPHHHHAYGRFAFDVDGKPSTVEEFNDPALEGNTGTWHTIVRERDAPDQASGQQAQVAPSATATAEATCSFRAATTARPTSSGVGDMWVVRHRSGEIDDGIGSDRARIGQVRQWAACRWETTRGLVRRALQARPKGTDQDHHVGPQLNPLNL